MLLNVIYMALEGKGRIVKISQGQTRHLSIPSKITSDSNFPFGDGEQVKITVDTDKNRIIVEKIE